MTPDNDNPYAAPQSDAFAAHVADDFQWDDRCERIAAVLRRSDVSAYLAAAYVGLYVAITAMSIVSFWQLGLFGVMEGILIAVMIVAELAAIYLLAAVATALQRLRLRPSVRELERVMTAHIRLFIFGSIALSLWMCLSLLGGILQWLAR